MDPKGKSQSSLVNDPADEIDDIPCELFEPVAIDHGIVHYKEHRWEDEVPFFWEWIAVIESTVGAGSNVVVVSAYAFKTDFGWKMIPGQYVNHYMDINVPMTPTPQMADPYSVKSKFKTGVRYYVEEDAVDQTNAINDLVAFMQALGNCEWSVLDSSLADYGYIDQIFYYWYNLGTGPFDVSKYLTGKEIKRYLWNQYRGLQHAGVPFVEVVENVPLNMEDLVNADTTGFAAVPGYRTVVTANRMISIPLMTNVSHDMTTWLWFNYPKTRELFYVCYARVSAGLVSQYQWFYINAVGKTQYVEVKGQKSQIMTRMDAVAVRDEIVKRYPVLSMLDTESQSNQANMDTEQKTSSVRTSVAIRKKVDNSTRPYLRAFSEFSAQRQDELMGLVYDPMLLPPSTNPINEIEKIVGGAVKLV